MKNVLILFFFALICNVSIVSAQQKMPKPPADQIKRTISPQKAPKTKPGVFINPMVNNGTIDWDIKLEQRRGIVHQVDMQDKMQVLKATKTAAKVAASKARAEAGAQSGGKNKSSAVGVAPIVVSSFEANITDGWYPPDNSMAISDDGYIVSVINSAISYYNPGGGQLLGNLPFSNFLASLEISSVLFDPKVIYDAVEEKFILVVLSGTTPETSNVVIGFSQSQNPSDGWNFYSLDGDYLDGNWFDFPNIAVSESDLFISGNLFTSESDFAQTVILQVEKSGGYDGEELNWEYFNNVENGYGGNAFTVVPAAYGYDGEYGPGIFMVSNFGFGGNEVFLYEVTGSVNEEQVINAYTINTLYYDSPGDAPQLGSDEPLSTGGCRIRNAFYNNGQVHFVFGFDIDDGYTGVRYQKIDVADFSIQTADFGEADTDIAYPTVVPFGMDESSESVMVGYLQVSDSYFARMGAVNLGEDLVFGPGRVVKQGETSIQPFSVGTQRWGDYSGGGRRHSSEYPNAWFFGCFGKYGEYGNWVFEVSDQGNGEVPIANWESTKKFGGVGHEIDYSDRSTNGAEIITWIFEGGTPAISNEPNPTVIYNDPGKFDVTQIVSNSEGSDTLLREEYANIIIIPVAQFSADVTSGPAPLTVQFFNESVNFNTTVWGLPGLTPANSLEENPLVVYENPGEYNVFLTVTNDFSNDVEIKFKYIKVTESTGIENEEITALKVSPNPIVDAFSVEFFLEKNTVMDIFLVDGTGKLVKRLLRENVKGGTNIFSFNKNALSAGVYFLVIKDDEQNEIRNEKIIISH